MNNKRSIRGIGFLFELILGPYLLISIILTIIYKPFFSLNFIPFIIKIISGTLLTLISIPLHVLSIIQFVKAYNNNFLETKGLFALSRNPMYTIIIFLEIPAGVLLLNSWLILPSMLIMLIVILLFIKKEEKWLENEFGNKFLKYKKKVGVFFIKSFKKK